MGPFTSDWLPIHCQKSFRLFSHAKFAMFQGSYEAEVSSLRCSESMRRQGMGQDEDDDDSKEQVKALMLWIEAARSEISR